MPSRTRWRVIAAGAIYVAGALGVEVLGQRYAHAFGWWSSGYVALSVLEESMEMAGAILYVRALAIS
jgi:hypothetical protein